jgi:hypothetical protein
MADFRAIIGVDDSENEEFLGFDLDNIKEPEEKYVRQLDVLNDFDSDIKFSYFVRLNFISIIDGWNSLSLYQNMSWAGAYRTSMTI